MPRTTFRNDLLPGSLRRHVGYWLDLRQPEDLALLIRTPLSQLQLLALKPRYKEYRIPKKDGSYRLIEDPAPDLKKVLRKVNHFLQAHYLRVRPASVHGFCIAPRREAPRNILSNARTHLGQPYLLNVDLEDFFHQVNGEMVAALLRSQFPAMGGLLRELLLRLVLRHGRLPMGAPTSPALSNCACLGLDAELESLAAYAGWRYSRFADDLSFPAGSPVLGKDEDLIRSTIEGAGFRLNPDKVRRFGPGEPKEVTGLFLREGKVGLAPDFLPRLREEIGRLRSVMLVEERYQTGMSRKKLRLLQQELRGKLAFAEMVLGGEAPEVIGCAEAYDDALAPRAAYESVHWLEIPYTSW